MRRLQEMIASLALILLFSLSACTSNNVEEQRVFTPQDTLQEQQTVTVHWMARWKGEGAREDLVLEVAKEFEATHPNIKLDLQFYQDLGLNSELDIANVTAEMIESGDITWDVILINTGQYQRVGDLLDDPQWIKKNIVDLSAEPGFRESQKDFIFDDPQYLGEFNGIFIGPYIEGFYCMLWYNKKMADEMGIQVKQYGMTIEDFLGYVEQVETYNQEHGSDIQALYEAKDWRTTEYMFQQLTKSAIGDLAAIRQLAASEEKKAALKRTLEAFEDLSQHHVLDEDYDENVWFDTRNKPLDGEALFYVNGAWMYNHWMGVDENKTYDMMPAELPVFEPVDFYIGSYTPQFAIMKDSPNKEAAIELLRFWSRPQVAEKWIRYTKSPTGIKGHLSTSDVEEDQFESFQRTINDKYGGNLHFSDNTGWLLGDENKLLGPLVNEEFIKVLAGEKTAQEAYDAIMEKTV